MGASRSRPRRVARSAAPTRAYRRVLLEWQECTQLPALAPEALAAFHPTEQVENFYVSNGYLLPNYHKYYWLGAQVNGPWPNFTWVSGWAHLCC